MGCASSIAPQLQSQQQQQQPGRSGRPKHKLNALVPEPPSRPTAPVSSGPRVGLVPASAPAATRPAGTLIPSSGGPSAAVVSDPQSYEELCVAFLKAVKRGDVPAMEEAAQMAVRLTPAPQSLVNIRGMWDSTPLVYAAQYGHAAAALWLLARGADVLARNEKGVTALLLASLEGLAGVCDKILSVAALMGAAGSSGESEGEGASRDERGPTAPRAVDQQVGVVYNSAADVNVRLSPLLAASMNGHAAVVALLLAHGADPNRPVGSAVAGGVGVGARQYALLLAAKHGHAGVLELLLAHAADRSVRDAVGSHAVLLACENRREDCALLLLGHAAYDQAGSDGGGLASRRSVWLQPNRHGLTALHLAATNGLTGAASALVALARQQSALDGGDAEAGDGLRAFLDAASATRSETALLVACRKRQFEVARVLLEAGADAARADRGGTTPAQVLARGDQPELLAMCRAVAAVRSTASHAVDEPGPSLAIGPRPSSEARAPADGHATGADDPPGRDSHDACASERASAGDKDECSARSKSGESEAEAPSGSLDQVSVMHAAEPSGSEANRPGDALHEGDAKDSEPCDAAAGRIESEPHVEVSRLRLGHGSAAISAAAAPSPDVEGDLGGKVGGLELVGAHLEHAIPSAAADGASDGLDAPSAPDQNSGSSVSRRELGLSVDATAAVSGRTAAPSASTVGGGMDRVAPLGELAGGPGAFSGDDSEPTMPPLLATGNDDGEAPAEPSSSRRKEVEDVVDDDDDDDDERPSSTASVSPKKETVKKASKRKKKKRDKSAKDPSSPPSPARHHRRHRPRATDDGVARPTADATRTSSIDGRTQAARGE